MPKMSLGGVHTVNQGSRFSSTGPPLLAISSLRCHFLNSEPQQKNCIKAWAPEPLCGCPSIADTCFLLILQFILPHPNSSVYFPLPWANPMVTKRTSLQEFWPQLYKGKVVGFVCLFAPFPCSKFVIVLFYSTIYRISCLSVLLASGPILQRIHFRFFLTLVSLLSILFEQTQLPQFVATLTSFI